MSSAVAAAVLVPVSALALALPGVLGITLLYPRRSLRWRWITGATLGLAVATYGSFLLSYLDIRLFPLLWVVLIAVLALAWARRANRAPLVGAPSPVGWMLLTLLIVTGLLRTGIVAGRMVPKGWDAAFHTVLAQKIVLSHRIISDWLPFEAVSLNYPLGSHTLLAGISVATGLPPHLVFNILFPLLCVAMVAEVYALGVAASRRTMVGVFACATFGFLAVVGSIDYVRWGGLPNALAMVLLLAVLRLLIGRDFAGRQWLLAILIAGLIVAHHHVMAVACVVLAMIVVVAWLRHQRDLAVAVLRAGVLGSLLALPHLGPYLLKVGQLSKTAVFHYETQLSTLEWMRDIGWGFCILTVAGALWYFGQRWAGGSRRVRIHWVIPASVALLLAIFVLAGVIWPMLKSLNDATSLGAFTPSRFVHDAVPMLAVFAGCAVYALVRARWLKPWPALILCMLGTVSVLGIWKDMLTSDWPADRCEAYGWIKANTPPQALILTNDSWSSYFAWRKTLRLPIPISEPQTFWEDRERLVADLDLVLQRKVTPPADLVVLRIRGPGDAATAPTIWQHPGGLAVELLWPPILPPSSAPAEVSSAKVHTADGDQRPSR